MKEPSRSRLLHDHAGASAVEQVLVLSLVALGAVAAWMTLGDGVRDDVECAKNAIAASASGPCGPAAAAAAADPATASGGGGASGGATAALTADGDDHGDGDGDGAPTCASGPALCEEAAVTALDGVEDVVDMTGVAELVNPDAFYDDTARHATLSAAAYSVMTNPIAVSTAGPETLYAGYFGGELVVVAVPHEGEPSAGRVTSIRIADASDRFILLGEPLPEPEGLWIVEVFDVIVGFTPLGWVTDARDLILAAQEGSLFGIALSLVGLVPGGDLAKLARHAGDGARVVRALGRNLNEGQGTFHDVYLALEPWDETGTRFVVVTPKPKRNLPADTEPADLTVTEANARALEGYGGPRVLGRTVLSDGREGLALEYVDGADIKKFRMPCEFPISDATIAEAEALFDRLEVDGYALGDPNLGNFMVTRDGHFVPIDTGLVPASAMKSTDELVGFVRWEKKWVTDALRTHQRGQKIECGG